MGKAFIFTKNALTLKAFFPSKAIKPIKKPNDFLIIIYN